MGKNILINDVQIFGGSHEQVIQGNILIEGSRIKAISETSTPTDGTSNPTIIDGEGEFLMPGLIDARWHIYISYNTMMDLLVVDTVYTQFKAGQEAEATLLRGFTTIRDAGGLVLGLKRVIDEDILSGSRIYPGSSLISQIRGYEDFRAACDESRPFDCCGLTHTGEIGATIIVDGVDATTVAARSNFRLGANQARLMTGGGVASLYNWLEDTQSFEEKVYAAVKAAEGARAYTTVHVYVPRAIQRTTHAGIKSIEHGHLIDEAAMELTAEEKTQPSVQPLTLEDNRLPTREQQEKRALAAQGTGQTHQLAKKYKVKLVWGAGLLFNPANTRNQNQGILRLQKWLSNFETLKMMAHDDTELLALFGTRNPYPGKLSSIRGGAWADLVPVNGNILKDITLLGDPERNFTMIMRGGTVYKNKIQSCVEKSDPPPNKVPADAGLVIAGVISI